MRRWISGIALLACVSTVRSEPFDANAAATALAPFVDRQTVAVARVEPSAVDLDAVFRFVPENRDAKVTATATAAAFAAAGGRDVFVVVSLDDVPQQMPFVVVPLSATANEGALTKLLALYPGKVVKYGSALVAATASTHKRLAAGGASPRPELAIALGACGEGGVQAVLVPSEDHRRVLGEALPELPAALGPDVGKTLRALSWVAASGDVKAKMAARLTVKADDAATAQAFAKMLTTGLGMLAGSKEAKELPALGALFAKLVPKADGDRVTLVADESTGVLEVAAEALGKVRQARGRSEDMNNLRQIALAWHNYHDALRTFPPAASQSKAQKPLLSWRVLILPYLEQGELYKQFKLDEPWDSEHNKTLIAKMPALYRPAAQKLGDGKTTILAPRGKPGPKNAIAVGMAGTRVAEITDGTSNTIMLVETNDDAAVIWTRPDDLEVTEAEPIRGLVGHNGDVFLVAFGDGSVRAIRKTIDAKVLWALFTRNGGEVVPNEAW